MSSSDLRGFQSVVALAGALLACSGAGPNERFGEMRANEAAGTGDQNLHVVFTTFNPASAGSLMSPIAAIC